ncbi:manganese-dependent ADP-ribose/CDP-alcohol diphosphatase [Pedobacter africanus]|uniref:Manganese-dependent ADP-ribose/CDP-alcohol diphosphatase n=1 Tax=Pedobacter africanus TaxID=151894 RepID=A0ACC6L1Q8_9SPHI|nr:metallophosphoesterase [Pedobacter africanus]MDR6785529.1 manganese-dependent ADP-ribose/CDP-alcohol diphosphatase [Pedobacter africanus]
MNKLTLFFIVLAITTDSFISKTQQSKPIIRIGLIADIQYADVESRGTRYYRNSLKKLRECVNDLNKQKVQFSLNLGDVIDRNPKDLDSVLSILKGLKKRIYTTTGNHDYHGITDNQFLYEKLDMPAEYYSFKQKDWLFIMLNTNEVASYANIAGTWKEKELTAMVDSIKQAKGVNAQEYNGGISSRQLQWLDNLLAKAQAKRHKVLIFSHHPLDFSRGFTALNSQEILKVIAKYSCIKALFAGHHHSGDFGYHSTIPCITLEGMVETSDKNAYGILEIYSNGFEVKGVGRTKSYKFQIGSN